MDYHRSLSYLYGLQKFGIKLGLDNIRSLLDRLGSPQHCFASVHVAGTNGKGSTAAALAEILQGSGYRVGLYTSPHLQSFTERIQVDRLPISESAVAGLTEQLRTLADDLPVTFFELTTAMALEYFRQSQIEIAILETGLGGRLDATNAVAPKLSVITPISRDHEVYLGADLEKIAAEKGGIIKSGTPVFSGPQTPIVEKVLSDRAAALATPFYTVGRDWDIQPVAAGFRFTGFGWDLEAKSGLPGAHQQQNLGLALAVAAYLQGQGWSIEPGAAVSRLANLKWPGRLEWWPSISDLLLDASHNPAGSQALVEYLEQSEIDRIHLVIGFKADKDWRTMLKYLKPRCMHVYVTEPEFEQVVDPAEVVDFIVQQGGRGSCHATPEAALWQALATRETGETVVVAGSIFLVSAIRKHLLSGVNERNEISF